MLPCSSPPSSPPHHSTPVPLDTPTTPSHLANSIPAPPPSLINPSNPPYPPAPTIRLEQLANSVAHLLQLGFWEEEEEFARSLILRKEASRTRFQTQIYQLLGIYFVFQGVGFASVAQSTSLTCKDWWSPFVLSLITSLATISAVWHKLAVSARVGEELEREKRRAEALYDMIFELRAVGVEFDLNRKPGDNLLGESGRTFYQKYIYTYGAAVTIILVMFSISILAACKRVLCHGCSCSS